MCTHVVRVRVHAHANPLLRSAHRAPPAYAPPAAQHAVALCRLRHHECLADHGCASKGPPPIVSRLAIGYVACGYVYTPVTPIFTATWPRKAAAARHQVTDLASIVKSSLTTVKAATSIMSGSAENAAR